MASFPNLSYSYKDGTEDNVEKGDGSKQQSRLISE